MARKMTRFTREDSARLLEDNFRRVVLETTDIESYRLATMGKGVAGAAVSDFANAKSLDQVTGGGSSEAWSYRSRGGRALKKAQAIYAELRQHGEHLAAFTEPSLATLLFIVRAVEWDAGIPATGEDHDVAMLACQKQLIHTFEGGLRRHQITAHGRSVLADMRAVISVLSA